MNRLKFMGYFCGTDRSPHYDVQNAKALFPCVDSFLRYRHGCLLAQPDLTGDRAVALKAIKDETIELDKSFRDKHKTQKAAH